MKAFSSQVRYTLIVLAMALAALLGILAGIAALLSTATITDRPPLFLLAALASFCAVYSCGVMLVTRKVGIGHRRRARTLLFCAGAVFVGLFAWVGLLPLGDEQLPPTPVGKQHLWELPTGSRIAHVRLPAEGRARTVPVIFLHGGPGIPDMRGDARYFGQLSREGFDVYVYEMVGRGRSSRLDDPRDYTL